MKTIKIWNDAPSDRQLQEIARDLRAGQTMIWPTDTMYALACDALNPKAIDAICRLKGINPEKQTVYISHGDCEEDAQYVAQQCRERLHVKDVLIHYIDPVIGAHSGPGTVALFFFGEQR